MWLAYRVAWHHNYNLVLLTDGDWDILVNQCLDEYVEMAEEEAEYTGIGEAWVHTAKELLDALNDKMGREI